MASWGLHLNVWAARALTLTTLMTLAHFLFFPAINEDTDIALALPQRLADAWRHIQGGST